MGSELVMGYQALAQFPSGNYSGSRAWIAIAAIAHNLAGWTSLIGHPDRSVQTAATRRRQLRRTQRALPNPSCARHPVRGSGAVRNPAPRWSVAEGERG